MKNSRSVIEKRYQQILNYIQKNGIAEVAVLAELLHVSFITIRRDLEFLEKNGLIERFHGGARLISKSEEKGKIFTEGTKDDNFNSKNAIMRRASEMIQDRDILFINSSSTALLLYQYIKDKSVVIVTNNARAMDQPRGTGIELILTGGEVYGNKKSLVGEFALASLQRITATKCILGVSGISVAGGITSKVVQETAINQRMIRRCSGPKIVVADHTKIGREDNFFSGKITDVTHLITDSEANTESLMQIQQAGIECIITES